MFHRHRILNIPVLTLVLALTAACTTAVQQPDGPGAAQDAATVAVTDAAVRLPTPTPIVAGAEVAAAEVAAPTRAAVSDPASLSLTLTPIVEGLDQPVFVTHAGDGSQRLFIVEKSGAIRILQEGVLLGEPLLDLGGRVSGGSEQGLLGLAFPPNFADSGFFFVNYTDLQGDTTVARFQVSAADPNRADPASEFTVLKLDQPAPNHNGGMLIFGPDGMLYVGMGDGGAANDRFGNGQNPATLLGKMLRIDVTSAPDQPYVVPPDNPWVAVDWNGQDVRDEVWAVGLRNPWRYSFDRTTGDLWIGDVGQNQWEEVNAIPAGTPPGLNFGWPIMEATNCFSANTCDTSGLTLPVHEYAHTGHCSITGGYVYRGQAQPAWQGIYFYGDYCSGTLWALAPDGDGGWVNAAVGQPGITLSSFGEDEAGELYVADMSDGSVYRLD